MRFYCLLRSPAASVIPGAATLPWPPTGGCAGAPSMRSPHSSMPGRRSWRLRFLTARRRGTCRSRHSSNEPHKRSGCMDFGSKVCGCTSARRKPLPKQNPRFAPARGSIGPGFASDPKHVSFTAMPATKPRIFNIPASAPFLSALTAALRRGELVPGFPASEDPLELARATLYLPTRRACRLARDAFAAGLDGQAILPRIIALGDLDEDEIIFAEAATAELAEDALALPPAISPLERRLLLAQLIVQWAAAIRPEQGAPLIANTPAAALGLADDLARLIDDVITRQMDWRRLDGLVPDRFDKYWQFTLDFLKIARTYWPERLNEVGEIDAAARRDLLIEAEIKRLAGSSDPVIAAGSTGSMPATAKLLAAIAQLPHGAVVLPGLDMELDEESWRRIPGGENDKSAPAAVHPQFAMQALLERIGITREAVRQLAAPSAHGREMLVSEALRPAATTDRWQTRLSDPGFAADADAAMAGVSVIEAANPEEEALSIAVCLRETIETPDKTVALVTPDRTLARRVAAALERWRVEVDDSGSDALADTSAGIFARLAAEVAMG